MRQREDKLTYEQKQRIIYLAVVDRLDATTIAERLGIKPQQIHNALRSVPRAARHAGN